MSKKENNMILTAISVLFLLLALAGMLWSFTSGLIGGGIDGILLLSVCGIVALAFATQLLFLAADAGVIKLPSFTPAKPAAKAAAAAKPAAPAAPGATAAPKPAATAPATTATPAPAAKPTDAPTTAPPAPVARPQQAPPNAPAEPVKPAPAVAVPPKPPSTDTEQ